MQMTSSWRDRRAIASLVATPGLALAETNAVLAQTGSVLGMVARHLRVRTIAGKQWLHMPPVFGMLAGLALLNLQPERTAPQAKQTDQHELDPALRELRGARRRP